MATANAPLLTSFNQYIYAIENNKNQRKIQLERIGLLPFQDNSTPITPHHINPSLQQQSYLKYGPNYNKDEETLRNDYSQHFIDSNSRPQNFIRNTDLSARFDEYPKLKQLALLKDNLVDERATPPMYIKADLRHFPLTSLGCKFDVIVIDPPLEEFAKRSAHIAASDIASKSMWTFDEVADLCIPDIAANPSFIFMWMGNHAGLDIGRKILTKWGYRRCEDIVWIKTNKNTIHNYSETGSVLQDTKEHCLMGIKGTVRRSVDSHFIHCNVDTDVIVNENDPHTIKKPKELYHIIEHFCLGRRRLYLFGDDSNIRRGWVTVGSELSGTKWDNDSYSSYFKEPGSHLLGHHTIIDELRPKTPPPKADGTKPNAGTSGGGIGMGYSSKTRKSHPPRWQNASM